MRKGRDETREEEEKNFKRNKTFRIRWEEIKKDKRSKIINVGTEF